MKAKLKYLYNPSISDLSGYCPEDPEKFCILFRAVVGLSDTDGEESFDIQVCTPQWFLSTMKKDDVIPGRHFLIVLTYNFERIYSKIKDFIESCNGSSWNEIAEKVSRIGYWEFEDYSDERLDSN